jgi:PKD repeat protein
MFSFSVSYAQLNGTYTVYGATPDYATIQAACTDLHTQGQSGPVIFDIRDGNHVEAVTLDTVAGNSSTNSITFQSESADSTLVNISSIAGNTFTFNSVDFVHFNNIGLTYSGPSGARVVFFNNGGNGSSFDNTAIFCSATNGGYAIYADRDQGINDFSFTNSTIAAHYGGIYLQSDVTNVNNFTANNSSITSAGSSNSAIKIGAEKYANNIQIIDCDLSAENAASCYIEGYYGSVNELSISNSTFSSVGSYAFYAYSDFTMNNGSILNSTFTSDNSYGYYMEGYYGSISNWTIKNSVFSAFYDAFHAYTEQTLSDMTFENDSMIANPNGTCCSDGEALYIGGNSVTENININNNYFYTDSANYGGYGTYIESDDGILTNVKYYDNTVKSEYGIYFYARSVGNNWWVNDNYISTRYDAMYLEPDYGSGTDITVTNNMIESALGDGIYVYSDASLVNCRVDSNTVDCYNNGIYLEGYGGGMYNSKANDNEITSANSSGLYFYTDAIMQNTEIFRNIITADDDGIELEAYEGGISEVMIYDNVIDAGYDGINIETDAAIQKVNITNNVIEAYDEGIYLDGEYGGVNEVLIDSNYVYSLSNDGISVNAYSTISNTTIVENEVYGDTVNCCDAAIYVESDDANMENVTIKNNEASAYYCGVYLEADAGNGTNCLISNNKIWAGEYGVYFEGSGSGSEISFNDIQPLASYGTQLDYGIYADGYGGPNTGISILNNLIADVHYRGIEASYFNDLVIENNEIISTEAGGSLYGITVDYIGGTNSRINANKILSYGESEGIDVGYSSFSSTNPFVISNNFITGFALAVELDNTSYIDFIHNSFSSANTNYAVYLSSVTDLNVLNNIFKNSNTTGRMYYGSSANLNVVIDYNVYNYDTLTSQMSNDSYFGINTSLFDIQNSFGMSASSFYADPLFTDDTLDLHIPCSNAALTAGTVTNVLADVDGFTRNATNPTIGAHEIAPGVADFLPDSINLCFPASLVSGATGTHLWSTGETTQVINVSAAGTFYCTVTDGCGNTSTDTVVVYTDTPVASFVWGLNDTQGLFNNTSTGGTSYSWDFGDQTTSTDENPVHYFPWGYGSYTVLLTVTNECGGIDTMSQLVTIMSLDVEEEDAQSLEFNLYPNPSTGLVTIEASESMQEISIYDMSGKLVYFQNNSDAQLQIDLSHLNKGMYIVKIGTADATVNRRVVLK